MGQQIRRVAVTESSAADPGWTGTLIRPYAWHTRTCEACDGTGATEASQHIVDLWYGKATFRPEDRGRTAYLPTYPAIWKLAQRNVERSPEFYGTGEEAILQEATRLCEHFNKTLSAHLTDADVLALVAANKLWDFTHTFSADAGWAEKSPPYVPTAQEVNDWHILGIGHDSGVPWTVAEAECDRLGVPAWCGSCAGEGSIWEASEVSDVRDAWHPTVGEGSGYQLWEVEPGSTPISPVFEWPDDLAQWLTAHPGNAKLGISKDTWEEFIANFGDLPQR